MAFLAVFAKAFAITLFLGLFVIGLAALGYGQIGPPEDGGA